MKLTFLGTSSCIPDLGDDTASLVINDAHIFDTGWNPVHNMCKYSIDPLAIRSVILTHFHQDHYIGLPQLLFRRGLNQARRPSKLIIAGPEGYILEVVRSALDFLQIERFQELKEDIELMPLKAGQTLQIEDLLVETHETEHISGVGQPEQSLAYKVTESTSGKTFVLTGDTSYYEPIVKFADRVQLLIHDSAHTSPQDAAKIARSANVERLLLIHYQKASASYILDEARRIFPNSFLAQGGEVVWL